MAAEIQIEDSSPIRLLTVFRLVNYLPSHGSIVERQFGMGFGDVVDGSTTTVKVVGLVGLNLEMVQMLGNSRCHKISS